MDLGPVDAPKRQHIVGPLLLAASAGALFLMWMLRVELIVLFGAALFGLALYQLSRWLCERTGLSYRLSVTLWFLAGIALAIGFSVFVGQQLSDQYVRFEQQLPEALETVESRLEGTPILGSLGAQIREVRESMLNDGSQPESQSPEEQQESQDRQMRVIEIGMRSLSLFVIWAMVSFYLAWEARTYMKAFLRLFPPDRRAVGRELAYNLATALPWWLVGRMSSMAAITVLTAIGLFVLGVPLAFVLAVIAGLFSFVPILGPIASVVPAVLITLQSTPDKLVWVLILYAAVQFLETNLITPLIQRQVASVPAVLLISAQVLTGVLIGIPGVIFSTPLALAILIVIEVVYVRHILGEDIPTTADKVGAMPF